MEKIKKETGKNRGKMKPPPPGDALMNIFEFKHFVHVSYFSNFAFFQVVIKNWACLGDRPATWEY